MERAHDLRAFEGLGWPELGNGGHQTRHLDFGKVDFLASKLRKGDISDFKFSTLKFWTKVRTESKAKSLEDRREKAPSIRNEKKWSNLFVQTRKKKKKRILRCVPFTKQELTRAHSDNQRSALFFFGTSSRVAIVATNAPKGHVTRCHVTGFVLLGSTQKHGLSRFVLLLVS